VVDDELDGDGAAHGVFRGGGDGFVEGVGVQAVAVVEQGVERLQGGADVVELDLLGVEAAPAGLDVVLEFLGAFAGGVAVFMARAQMRRATRPITAYSGSMPLLKKKLRLGAKSSMRMPRER